MVITDLTVEPPLFHHPDSNIHAQIDHGDFVESRHVNTGYGAMNDTDTTKILRDMNDAMFLRLSPAVAFLALLMTIGVMGNLAICYIFGFKLGASTQNFLLLSIGIFDLLSCTLGIPAEIIDLRHYFLFESEELCKIMRFCTTFPTLGSIQVLLVIAADRYRKVCQPLYGQIELIHARLALAAILIVAFVFSVPALYLYGHRTFQTKIPGIVGQECSIVDKHAGGRFPIVYQTTLATCFVISTIALSIIYLKIWMETKRHRKYMKRHTKSIPGDTFVRQDNSSSSDNESLHAFGDASVSTGNRRSLLWKGIKDISNLGRARSRKQSRGSEEGDGHAQFNSADDVGPAQFDSTDDFGHAQFNSADDFGHAQFNSTDDVGPAQFDSTDDFGHAQFNSADDFGHAQFNSADDFGHAQFNSADEVGHAQLNNDLDMKNSDSVNDDPLLSQAELSVSTTSLSASVEEPVSRNIAFPVVPLTDEFRDDNTMQGCYDTDGEAHELLPSSENTCFMDAASRSVVTFNDKNNAKESLHGNKERIRRLRSLPSHSLKNLTSLRQLKIRDQRKCSSENLDNIFSKTAFSVESSKTGTPHITYPNLSLKLENGAAFGVDVINPCNANGNLSVEEEIINDERVSFISDSYACGVSDRRSKTLGSVRYDRMFKSQSQYEFSASGTGSDCSLHSLLSTPSIQNPSLGAKLLSPRPKSKLGRMVLSKNLRRIKSNPLFLQASMDNASHSRPVCELGLTMNYEPPTGRNRSQSDPPARLYNLRDSQSQLFSPLSKGKSKSSQSLAMQRVKKAFRATRATVIACAITTAFVLSYLPHLSLTLLRSVWIEFEHQLDGASLVLYNIFIRSYFVNTAINIFVYGTMNREFRDEASKIWTQIKSSCSRRK